MESEAALNTPPPLKSAEASAAMHVRDCEGGQISSAKGSTPAELCGPTLGSSAGTSDALGHETLVSHMPSSGAALTAGGDATNVNGNEGMCGHSGQQHAHIQRAAKDLGAAQQLRFHADHTHHLRSSSSGGSSLAATAAAAAAGAAAVDESEQRRKTTSTTVPLTHTTTPPPPPPAVPLAARVLSERSGRRRHKSGRHGKAGPATAGSGGGGTGRDGLMDSFGARYSRTAFDRCKTARTMAVQWISQLMSSPPAAVDIAAYRARLVAGRDTRTSCSPPSSTTLSSLSCKQQRLAASTQPLSAAEASTEGTESGQQQQQRQQQQCRHTVDAGGNNGSFREAVLKAKSGVAAMTPSPSTPPHTATSHAGDATVSEALPVREERAMPTHGASSRTDTLELMPIDLEVVPDLLRALREIALSCASLDALAKASSGGGNSNTDGGGGGAAMEDGEGGKRRGSGRSGCRGAPPVSAACSTSPSGAIIDEAILVTRSPALSGEYDTQWVAVRTHLVAVQQYILNEPEVAAALDAALGKDWHLTLEGEDGEEGDGEGGATMTSAAAAAAVTAVEEDFDGDERIEGSPPAVAVSAASAPVASTLRRSAPEYVPREHVQAQHTSPAASTSAVGSPDSSFTTTATATNMTSAAALAASSTLNSNAEPFRTRYPSTSVLSASSPATTPSHADPSAAAVYSPSQAVASFLERLSPPPRSELTLTGAIFPSTPPASVTPMEGISSSTGVTAAETSSAIAVTPGAQPGSPASSPVFSTGSTTAGGGGGTVTNGGGGTTRTLTSTASVSSVTFQLESREDMLRRRNAAPNTFYASTTHHYSSGSNPASPVMSTGIASSHVGHANAHSTNSAAATPASLLGGSPNMKQGIPGSFSGYHGPLSMPVSPSATYSTPVMSPQPMCPYDYILVIDFEATCEEHPPSGYLYEIIEFPVVLVDVRLQRAVAEFHRFVRPHHKSKLSDFCRALTGIDQSDVDEAAPLEEVIVQFERWYRQTVPHGSRAVFATDGPMDFKEFMHNHAVVRQNIRFPSIFYQWVDVKQVFASFFQCQQGRIKAMLEVLRCPFEGRLHSGIDDARNIARIVIGLLQWGCTFREVPLSRISVPTTSIHLGGGSSAVDNGNFTDGNANNSNINNSNGDLGATMGGSTTSMSTLSGSLALGSPIYLPPSTAATSYSRRAGNSWQPGSYQGD